MTHTLRTFFRVGIALLTLGVVSADARAQTITIRSADDLVSLPQAQLDALYAGGTATGLPPGRIRGRIIYAPGTPASVPASKVGRLLWQGKNVDPTGAKAVNRFFGVPSVRGNLYLGQSWRDGNPALILDYTGTSLVYARNRDEMREVAPGVWLGVMYAKREGAAPTLKTYFALDRGE